jgi:uncharacterized repeat protein (TIGR04076 family)
MEFPKVKITVIKRTVHQDLVDEYLADASGFGPCERYHEGQEFVLESPFGVPEGFCPWAWADLRHDIMAIVTGSEQPWLKQPGMTIGSCSDWFRPVLYKVERLE